MDHNGVGGGGAYANGTNTVTPPNMFAMHCDAPQLLIYILWVEATFRVIAARRLPAQPSPARLGSSQPGPGTNPSLGESVSFIVFSVHRLFRCMN